MKPEETIYDGTGMKNYDNLDRFLYSKRNICMKSLPTE